MKAFKKALLILLMIISAAVFVLACVKGSTNMLYAIIPALVVAVCLVSFSKIKREEEHEKTSYYQVTGKTLKEIENSKGTSGEYQLYNILKAYETYGAKIIENAYIPKGDGTYTEIDLIMVCRAGVFVYECKNYSGWIFGDKDSKYWMQTLRSKNGKVHKEQFYNPIMQNKTHMKYLMKVLGEIEPFSMIVFSDNCVFKKVYRGERKTAVVHMSEVIDETKKMILLSDLRFPDETIDVVYKRLLDATRITDDEKRKHVENIRMKYNKK